MSDRLLSLEETVNFLGISKPTIYRMIREKTILAYKVRGNWRFRMEDLEEYLRNNSNLNQTKDH